jgi:hypothetical protein
MVLFLLIVGTVKTGLLVVKTRFHYKWNSRFTKLKGPLLNSDLNYTSFNLLGFTLRISNKYGSLTRNTFLIKIVTTENNSLDWFYKRIDDLPNLT